MADTAFQYLPMPYVGLVAAREAVLRPILKGIRKEPLLKLPLEGQHERLQALWRLRATKLGEAGWGRGKVGEGLQYLRNCPPFGVRFGDSTRSRKCSCRRVCPNCFARETVVAAYDAVSWAFYMKNNKPVVAYDLVAIRKSWEFDTGLDEIFAAMSRDRSVYKEKFTRPGGSLVVSTVEPSKKGWKIQLSTLVAADPDDRPDLGEADTKRVSVEGSQRMTKKKLARIVGWALRYPLGMMYGDEAKTAKLMMATDRTSKVRQFVAAGALRNKTHRKMSFRT